MNKTVDLLKFPFFSGISRKRVAEIESLCFVQHYGDGDTIFQNNEPARNLYGLIEGEVELSILFKEEIITKDIKYEEYIRTHVEILEKPVIIEDVHSSEIFGWSALVKPEKMTALARCVTDCEVVLIPAPELRKVFNSDPELGYLLTNRISSIIAKRLNSRTEKLIDAWCSLFETERISTI